MADPLLAQVGTLSDVTGRVLEHWETADGPGRGFLADVLQDACERVLTALEAADGGEVGGGG